MNPGTINALTGLLSVVLIFSPILIWAVVWALRVLRGSTSRRDRHLDAEEAKLMQELHQGLTRMEARVEALETILLERRGKEGHK